MLTGAFIESLNELTAGWFELFTLSTIKIGFLCLVMLLIVRSLKRLSASTRYLVLLLTVMSGFAIPAMTLLVPSVDVFSNQTFLSSISNRLDSLTRGQNATAGEPNAVESLGHAAIKSGAGSLVLDQTTTTRMDNGQLSLLKLFEIRTVLFGLWAVVVLLGLIRIGLGFLFSARIVRQSEPLIDTGWQQLVNDCRQQFNIRSEVRILLSPSLVMPSIHGIWRPSIILPAEAVNWSYARSKSVLLHELAHIARRDCAAQLFCRLSHLLNWFNPMIYLAVKRLQIEREKACDNLVLQSGIQSDKYAQELLSTAVRYQGVASTALGMARPKEIESRIRAILDQTTHRKQLTKGAKMLVATIVLTMSTMLSSLAITNEAGKSVTASATKLSVTQSDESGSSQLSEKEIEQLLSEVESVDPKIREKGIARLEALGGNHPAVLYILKQLYNKSESDEELFSKFMPAADKKSQATKHLIAELSSTLSVKRAALARALGQIGDRRAVEPLITLLKDENASVREWSARSLLELADSRAVTPLFASLNDESYTVREWAIRALANIGDDRAVQPLIKVLKDKHGDVREWAVRALGQLGDRRVVDQLIPLLNDEDPDVSEWAIRAIAEIESH